MNVAFIFCPPHGGAFIIVPLIEGVPYFCPPHRGGAGGGFGLLGEQSLQQPPPAEDKFR